MGTFSILRCKLKHNFSITSAYVQLLLMVLGFTYFTAFKRLMEKMLCTYIIMINREWTIWNARKFCSSHESSQDRDPSLDKEKLNWKNSLTRFSILFLSSKPLFWHHKLNFKSRCLTFIENFDKPPTSYGLFFHENVW